jgi:hypothetical protein
VTSYGERLDLDYAIAVCFANGRTAKEKRADREQVHEVVFRPKSWGGGVSTTVEYIRRHYDEHPAAWRSFALRLLRHFPG